MSPIASQRFEVKADQENQKPKAAHEPPLQRQQQKKSDALALAKVPAEILQQHARVLSGAVDPAIAVASYSDNLGWRAPPYGRLLTQFYSTLGKALEIAPPDGKKELAEQSIASLKQLVETVGSGDDLIPCVGAAISLFDLFTRTAMAYRTKPTAEQWARAFPDAATTMERFLEEAGTRPDAYRMYTLFPAFLEQLERGLPPMSEDARVALAEQVRTFLVENGPITGFQLDTAALLSQALAKTLQASAANAQMLLKKGAGPILEHTREAFLENFTMSARDLADDLAQQVELKPGNEAQYAQIIDALQKTAAAHPTAPEDLKQALYTIRNVVEKQLKRAPNPAKDPIYPALSSLIGKLGRSETAIPSLSWLAGLLSNIIGQSPKTIPLLLEAVEAEGGALAVVMAKINAAASRVKLAGSAKKELAQLEQLDSTSAIAVALALRPILSHSGATNGLVVKNLIQYAQTSGAAQLEGAAVRLKQIANKMHQLNTLKKKPALRDRVLVAFTRASESSKSIGNGPHGAAKLIDALLARFPQADIAKWAMDAHGQPGIWRLVDPSVRYRFHPAPLLDAILAIYERVPPALEEMEDAGRYAMDLAAVVGNLDGYYKTPFERMSADLEEALKDPDRITYLEQDAVGVRAQQKKSLFAFVRAHPDLPLELCATAAIHLSKEQLTWASKKCEQTRGRDTVRSFRDMIFAAVTADRKDVIESLRVTKAPGKTISRTMHYIADRYREYKLDEIPWDEIVDGIESGRDPIEAIENRQIDTAMAKLNLEALVENPSVEGMAEIARSAEAIASIMEHLVPGKVTDNVSCERLRPIFEGVLRDVAEGKWPAFKYDTEVGQKNLACLTVKQRALWREESVTSLGGADPHDVSPQMTDALALTKGVAASLSEHPEALNVGGLEGLRYDDASLERAEAKLAEVITALHDTKKGSKRNKELASRAALLKIPTALLRFERAVANVDGNPRNALLQLRPVSTEVTRALKKIGRNDLREAISQANFVARTIRSSAKHGTYAADEDNLFALLTSTSTGGCAAYYGNRRFANVGFAAHASDKMIRVYDNGKLACRSLYKLLECKIGDYEGPILYLCNTGKGGGSAAHHHELLVRHAISKARAMGVPIASNEAIGFIQTAKAMGLPCQSQKVLFRLSDNATGTCFTNYTVNPAKYHDIRAGMGNKPYLEVKATANLVML